MPRIQEYLPEEAAAQPQGGSSANLEVVGELGRGVQQFGRGVTELSDTIESRTAMMESADAQAQTAETKANFYDRIKEDTNSGTLNQGQVFKDYDDWVNKTSDQFSTARGKAEFERASGRTRGALIRWAAQGSAQIAGANALADHTATVNSLTDLTAKDPHSFADNMGQLEELYNGYHNDVNMNKNPAALQRMKQAEQAQMAAAAVQGQMSEDFNSVVQDMQATDGKVDPSDPKYNTAKGMLDSGVYDEYLNSEQKNKLAKETRANFSAAQTEGSRILDVQKSQDEAKIQQWQSSVVGKMATGQLSTKEILAGAKANNMTMESTLAMIRSNAAMAKLTAEKKDTTPPELYNKINDQILNGKIDSAEQIMKYANQGLTGTDYEKFHSLLDKTPAGRLNLENEKAIISKARARLVNENLFLGKNDPVGQDRLMIFNNALYEAKKKAIDNGQSADSVLNPNSKDYFGSIQNIDKYRLTSQEQMEAMRSKLGVKPKAPEGVKSSTPPPGLTREQFFEWKKNNGQ